MDPLEAAQGFEALRARHLLAMHRGTFRLTDEPIGGPPRGSAPTGPNAACPTIASGSSTSASPAPCAEPR